jgi:hypothetical protein
MKSTSAVAVVVALVAVTSISAQQARPAAPATDQARASAQSPYFPERLDWQHKRPDEIGMSAALVSEAVQAAVSAELPNSRDSPSSKPRASAATSRSTRDRADETRGPASGLIAQRMHRRRVGRTGPRRHDEQRHEGVPDHGGRVAWQRGLIRDLNDRARLHAAGRGSVEAEHNQKITWDHLLRQTSDWQGTLWGKPDWADRPEGKTSADWPNRPLREPGTYFKYNDVRVNVLALAALQVIRKPLPQVLREEVMEPIGASSTWRWYGYENSWVDIDGQKVQSVSGGGHWGGGMFINAYDMARFGYLFLRNGKWKDRPIVSEKWIEMARKPGPANATYGFANWH